MEKCERLSYMLGKSFLERPIQHLYTLELARDKVPERAAAPPQLNAGAPAFRLRRGATVAATLRIHDTIEVEKL